MGAADTLPARMTAGSEDSDVRSRSAQAQAGRIERAFSTQAAAFEDPRVNRPLVDDLEWLFERLAIGPDDLVLDVATGTGHAARLLARRARAVVGVDATAAMLQAGRASAERAGQCNLVFVRGDATALPFLDGSFDAVVSRFAAHHFEDPRALVAEMTRCLRPGGGLVLADMVAADDTALAAEQDRLERLRDPSHVRMLTAREIADLLHERGLTVGHIERRQRERPLQPWLDQARTPPDAADEVRERLRDELAGGPPSGFAPRQREGELHFTQTFAAVTATAPR